MGGGLTLPFFCRWHFRQEVEISFAINQDRGQHLAVFCEQDTFAPFLGSQPNAEHEANRPIARNDAAVVVDHKDRAIRLRLIGEGFRDFVVAIEDRFDDA